MSLKSHFLAIAPAFGKAFICLGLALYSCLRPGIPLRSSGLASTAEQMQAVRQQRGATIAFGLLILLLALVPALNLLLPALLGAGSCHLAYRALDRLDSPAGAACMPQVSLPAP